MARRTRAVGWLRRRAVRAGLAVLSCVAANAAAAAPDAPARRVVLITVDTLRADHVGAYGGPVPTPGFDRLAAEGVLVEQACTPVPSTGPAHASLLTGLHPWRHGTLDNAVALDPRIPTIADRASGAGVPTAAFVSSYVLGRRFGFHQGFETFVFEPGESYAFRGRSREEFWTRGEHTVRAAMQWITAHADRSFFLWVHLFDPHTPYRPPPGFALTSDHAVDLSGKLLPPRIRSRDRLAQLIRAYRGEVRYADAQVGRLVQRLELLGILDETAVVLTSDHGEGLGDHGLLEHGLNLFDELVRVPLLVRGPGLGPGRRLAGDAQLEDLAPTVLALLGVPPLAAIDGIDLLPWLAGEAPASPRAAVLGRRKRSRRHPDLFYQRRWPEKWIGRMGRPGLVLDLATRPGERGGERGEGPPEILRATLERARSDAPAPRAVDPDPEVLRALEALGYTE